MVATLESNQYELAAEDKGSNKRLRPLMQFALIVGPFMAMIDSSVVNIAIPVIDKSFNAPLSEAQWVASAYLLSLGAFLVISPYVSKKYGPIRPYSVSLGGFTVFSLVCAFSPSISFLIGARIAQGAFGSLMVPLAMDLLFGESKGRERISPLIGIVLFLAPAIGPTLGGALIQIFGWPSIFLINVPVGVVAVTIIARSKEFIKKNSRIVGKFDFVGSTIFGIGIAAMLYGSSRGTSVGWSSIDTVLPLLIGTVLMVVYYFWAKIKENPSVNLRIIRNSKRATSLTVSILANVVLFSAIFLIPVFVELVDGLSPLEAGLILLPQGITTGFGTIIGEYWSRRGNKQSIVRIGMIVLTASTVPLAFLTASSSSLLLSAILCGRGIALGLTIQPLLYQILSGLSPSDVPDGNTLFNVAERISGAFGISLLASFFESREKYYASSQKIFSASKAGILAFHETIIILIILSVVGVMVSVFTNKFD